MIRMVYEEYDDGDYGNRPTVFCDECGDIIEKGTDGVIAWIPSEPLPGPERDRNGGRQHRPSPIRRCSATSMSVTPGSLLTANESPRNV